ncbi:hypothetical protein FHG87_018244 [Trinorchestia longiramus]|nr:hypothetical protein FHG87_018244 [Trinorchestia longiramus]
MKPAGVCLAVGSLFLLVLPVSGDGVPAHELPDSKQCSDVNGLSVQSGVSYTPGPDYCTVCKCEDGSPKFCRAVFCQPRPDCHSFRVGTTCCDFICLDDVLPNRPGGHPIGRLPDGTHYPAGGNGIIPHIHENGENSLGMRLAAAILTALMAFVLLLFLVHRLRQRRITAQQYVNAQDVACCHPAAYWHTSDQAALFLQSPHWKPPSCVIDAPPPYTEADAQRAAARAVFSNGVVTSMPSSAPPSYSGPVPSLPFSPPDGRGVVLPVTSLNHHHVPQDTSRDVLCSPTETRPSDSASPGGGGHLPPASLGPLAVQLLPAASNSADLREQIRRQRRNLTDHNTRSLPRATLPPPGGTSATLPPPGGTSERPTLHCTLARPPAAGAPIADTQVSHIKAFEARHSVENSPPVEGSSPVENSPPVVGGSPDLAVYGASYSSFKSSETLDTRAQQPLQKSLQCSVQATENSDESSEHCDAAQDDANEEVQDSSTDSSSNVRKSVLKFEAAAAAREASEAHSGGCSSPAGITAQHSPSCYTSSAPRHDPSSSPFRGQELPHVPVDCPSSEGTTSAQETSFHFPNYPPSSQPLTRSSHPEGNFPNYPSSQPLTRSSHPEGNFPNYPPSSQPLTRSSHPEGNFPNYPPSSQPLTRSSHPEVNFPNYPPSSKPLTRSSHPEDNFHPRRGDSSGRLSEGGGDPEILQRRYPSYDTTFTCARQPLLPRDTDTSSPGRAAKAPRRRQHVLVPDAAAPECAFAASRGSGPISSHFSNHHSKAQNQSSDAFQRSLGDENFEVNDRQFFGYSNAGHRNAEVGGDLQNFRISGRRFRHSEPSTVDSSSGARNKT